SRTAAIDSVQAYFENAGVTVVYGVDTRALVRHIRSCGAMNAIISGEVFDTAELQKIMAAIPSMEGLELSSKVSVQQAYETGPETAEKKVALLDLGVKENIIRCLTERDVRVKVFPMNTPLAEMQAWNPDGYLISNGPGDPETLTGITRLLKDMIAADLKIFGICLGHQVLGQALGMETFKMFNGHRGINHPILNHLTGKGEITTQNHGFAIKKENIPDHVEITHSHLNDGTVAGIRIKNKPVFSVQYHPEASAGPHDSRYLFDEFVASL
ncbi:MAG: glutamine-hydrolyzing carbamoyl-phosphate synthase small subunit, partial [Flavobacteriales bacterium]